MPGLLQGTCVGIGCLAVLLGWLAIAGVTGPDTAPVSGGEHAIGQPTADEPLPASSREDITPRAESQRSRPLAFAEYLEQLVALSTKALDAMKRGRQAEYIRLDGQGRELFAELRRRVEVPEERALHTLTGLMSEDTTVSGRIRRSICLQLIKLGLEERWQRHGQGGRRQPLDNLVLAVLSCLCQDEVLARELGGLLTSAPYLCVAHENAVLDIVVLVEQQPFLAGLATELLLTLWANLEARGERTSEDITSLALLFKDDVNPSRRLAALRHLLEADGGRLRDLVVRQTIERRDPQLLSEIAIAVARRLPPQDAMGYLLRINQVSQRGMTTALMTLAMRDATVIESEYERQLANDSNPRFRSQLITGAGFQAGTMGMKLALKAFEFDPHPDVRSRALMAITGRADAARAERSMMTALDDPRFRDDGARLGQLVLALENLAAQDAPNAVRRIADRMLANGKLRDGDRRRLQRILARGPGGK